MATLTALKFSSLDGAKQVGYLLKDLQGQQLLSVIDAAVVSWPVGSHNPKTYQLHNLAGVGALGGAFWGGLFGLIFFMPLVGALGLVMSAFSGAFADIGVDYNFIEEARNEITEGTSALFLLAEPVELVKAAEAIKSKAIKFELVAGSLSRAPEKNLPETLVV
jgi:uncharacterized membrane protein